MTKRKVYVMPEDICKMFSRAEAMDKIAKFLASKPFCLKKAIKLKQKSLEIRSESWYAISKFYPELRGQYITADWKKKIIYI